MTLDSRLRVFGLYPLAGAIYEGWVNMQPNGVYTLLNPRYFASIPFARYPSEYMVFCWAATIWLAIVALGCLIGTGRSFIVIYWYSELLLAAPLMLWIGVAVFNHLGQVAPGQHLPECLTMLFFFTVVPVVWAMRLGARVQEERILNRLGPIRRR